MYNAFVALIFIVMLGESFSNVYTNAPSQKEFLYDQLLFLDTTTASLVIMIYLQMSAAFILLGCFMIQRIKHYPMRYIVFIPSIKYSIYILSIVLTLIGLRFFAEILYHDELASACDNILANEGNGSANHFITYWFSSILITEFACYITLIYAIYLRKQINWDMFLRLPLKIPLVGMENLLGGLIEETEANKFKH